MQSAAELQAIAQVADDAWTAAYQAICPKRTWPGDFRYTDAAKGAPGSELHALHEAYMRASDAWHKALTREGWLREASRHQQNAAHCAAMAMSCRDYGNHSAACDWQRGAEASAHNARSNLFAAMNLCKVQPQAAEA